MISVPLCLLGVVLSGCTTGSVLRGNTYYQGVTVRDLIADQVLFNLAIYYDYFCSRAC